ncbi:hypothetical protein [Iningainema tapete]|uniref:Uncharacterized protein n=1 Tax=Iningainema tapete BLCC-T55 TaxID=2748662 RepID=A0A8J6XC24_9CYAN|nr:hypothetical protein [Iningainema tapete]MBD2772119.1 hypothetical protein [Iningainema tapete BLCC-T55]
MMTELFDKAYDLLLDVYLLFVILSFICWLFYTPTTQVAHTSKSFLEVLIQEPSVDFSNQQFIPEEHTQLGIEVKLPTNELASFNEISNFQEIGQDTVVVSQMSASHPHATLVDLRNSSTEVVTFEELSQGSADLRSQSCVEVSSLVRTDIHISGVENQLVVNIDLEKQKLMEFSFRKLRIFCSKAPISGYSAYVNSGGKESLVDYLLSLSVSSSQIVECLQV